MSLTTCTCARARSPNTLKRIASTMGPGGQWQRQCASKATTQKNTVTSSSPSPSAPIFMFQGICIIFSFAGRGPYVCRTQNNTRTKLVSSNVECVYYSRKKRVHNSDSAHPILFIPNRCAPCATGKYYSRIYQTARAQPRIWSFSCILS